MADRKREQLLGYLLGALEEPEQERVEQRLARDLSWREEFARVDAMLRPLRHAPREFTPPPGLAARTCEFIALFAPSAAHEAMPAEAMPADAVPADTEDQSPPPMEAEAAEADVAEAEFACVAETADIPRAAHLPLVRPPRMHPVNAPPSSPASWSWADMAVAACILVALAFLVIPAMERARMNARTIACQQRLHDTGTALTQAGQFRPGLFPQLVSSDAPLPRPSSEDLAAKGTSPVDEPVWSPPPLPVERLDPQRSVHLGIGEPVLGQNVLFADGRAALLVTGPAITPREAELVQGIAIGLPLP